MDTANACAVTMVYNEAVNLPIWRRYYGAQIGTDNLFIIDDGSNDGSTDNVPNLTRLPRAPFDDVRRVALVSAFCRALLSRYDAVICTDCDEIVVADTSKFDGLLDYLSQRDAAYATCTGLNVVHLLTQEKPLDLNAPILAQRRYALFRSSACKPSVSRIPLEWSPGFHTCNRPPAFDPDLYLFHLARMDYGIATARHDIAAGVDFSDSMNGMGAHWRYATEQFVREGFLDPMHLLTSKGAQPFEFGAEIAEIGARSELINGRYRIPMELKKLVEIPKHLRDAF